ncbi:MAG TPA: 3-hydroxyacyl-CoA dehydrogenase NAD-binding domain-containing protein [Steroidobacteraceae bacterium]|nr:3-hydroxyacyl-CoA dehydrogenase NAD-binding domain-containing protein [Steroidobacteraceae bacterium]
MSVDYRLDGAVAVLVITNPPGNALNPGVRSELQAALTRAAHAPQVHAIVLSGAAGTFCAGTDVVSLDAGALLQAPTTCDLQAQLEASRKPVVAALEGAALGEGFELALAAHWRVAGRDARLGLPDLKLGLIPGAGGTLRCTRLAGAAAALEMIGAARALGAPRALELGLVDELADEAQPAARALARQVLAERRALPRTSAAQEPVRAEDPKLFAAARRRLHVRAYGPLAPARVVDCIEAACTRPPAEALRLEREYFRECLASHERRALVHVFLAERAARTVPDVPPGVQPLPIRTAAVIGAGTMGTGIAMTFASAGIPVVVLEASPAALDKGLALVRKNYAASVARGSLSQQRADAAAGLVKGSGDYEALKSADIVIEAVFEDLKVKQQVFARLDEVAAPHAILATNTSTLDIDAIAASTGRPGQVVGTHFFSPAHVMKLLENVRGRRTSAQTLVTVMQLGTRLGKVPVLAGNCDGFIGNLMLMYYGAQAEFLLEQGATPEQIDRVIEGFGFAMGPLAVRDLAGNDVGLLIRKGRRLPPDERWSPILERLVQAGRLGQKAGRGYYRYEGRTRLPDPEVLELIEGVSRELGIARRPIADAEILASLLHPLVNEGARLLAEGIAQRAGDIDVVYVNGYGFPAWRGGPMYWAQHAGIAQVVETMRRLSSTNGARWRPAPLLERMAATGEGWDNVTRQGSRHGTADHSA